MDVRSGEDSTSTLISGYAESATALFHKGSETNISADSLSGKSVGVQTGSLSERAMGQVLTGMSVQGFSNLMMLLKHLKMAPSIMWPVMHMLVLI